MPLRGVTLSVLRPRDSEALLSEEAFERDEFLPYWAELWPAGVALADAVSVRAWRGARVLELGCGLGLPAIAAALGGARVLATDWAPDSLEITRVNAERNGAIVETALCDWRDPPAALMRRGPWDLVLGADLIYEHRNLEPLLALLPRLAAEAWIADPGRAHEQEFLDRARAGGWTVHTRRAGQRPSVALHRLIRERELSGLTCSGK